MAWNPEDFASPEVKAEIRRLDTAVTPGSAELLALAGDCERYAKIIEGIIIVPDDYRDGDDTERREPRTTLLKAAVALRLAAKPADDDGPYLVWSNKHRAWWRPNSAGYTDDVKRAGRYSRAEAMSISFHGRDGWDSPKGVPDELAIAERDVPVFTVSTTVEPKR